MAELTIESIFTPERIADPYPMYHQLRESAPVLKVPNSRLVVVSRYADVQATLRDKRLGHGEDPSLTELELEDLRAQPAYANLRRTMLLANPPDHTRLRSLVVRAFDARRVNELSGRIREIANELVDQFVADGSGDLVKLFNHPLPVIVICDMLGIPVADRSRFVGGSRVSGRLIDPTPMTRDELDKANANTLESLAYFEGLCDARRREPREDLLTALVQSETEHGKLSREELTANISLLFAAGHETTVNLIGNSLIALYRNPEQLELLRRHPERIPDAVEELVRFDSSVQISGRNALEDAEVAGEPVAAGSMVLTLLGAANRDPAVFREPDRLDVERTDVRPVSFGGGIHYCLGAQLARQELGVALSVLFERLPGLELDDVVEPDWKPTITLRGPATLPARW